MPLPVKAQYATLDDLREAITRAPLSLDGMPVRVGETELVVTAAGLQGMHDGPMQIELTMRLLYRG